MREHESHRPGPEIEVTLTSREIRWRHGEHQGTAPLELSDEAFEDLGRDYRALVGLADTKCDGDEYKRQEKALGEALAGFLLQADGSDNSLATALNELLSGLGAGEYVRLLMCFEDTNRSELPWELTRWKSLVTRKEICLGRHGDIALSRLERGRPGASRRRVMGMDGILSILNIGTDDNATAAFDRTDAFIGLIDDHIPQVHAASRQSVQLKQYWVECFKILGGPPEIDIVHWNGHGTSEVVEAKTGPSSRVALSAAELVERTQSAFLYVVQSCHSGGCLCAPKSAGDESTGTDGGARRRHNTFSDALLDHGASAVLGMHDGVAVDQFEDLPMLYALLSLGLPLDYSVQFMRRYFGRDNVERQNGPYEPWYKLMLRTSHTSYLDGSPTAAAQQSPMLLVVDALATQYAHSSEPTEVDGQDSMGKPPEDVCEISAGEPERDLRTVLEGFVKSNPGGALKPALTRPVTRRAAPDTLSRRLYDTALLK
jgi:hypothetical protein